MVAPEIIKGFDKQGREIFSRQAREYDKGSIENKVLGISIGDLVKAIPVIFAAGMMFAHFQASEKNQTDFNKTQIEFNNKMSGWIKNESEKTATEVIGINKTLEHIDVSLTQITGYAFNDGMQLPTTTTTRTTTTTER